MRRALTQRMTAMAGWATLLVTLAVCALGIHLTEIQSRGMSGVLLDLEKRSAESVRAAIEGLLDEKESRILGEIAVAGDETAALDGIAAREPLVSEPFLFLADGTLVTPILGRRPAHPGLTGDDAPPPVYEKAMKALWNLASAAEKVKALDEVCSAADAAPEWKLRARVQALALLSRSGEFRRAREGYRELFEEVDPPRLEGSLPSYLQLVTARAECLAAGGDAPGARRLLESTLSWLESGQARVPFPEEQLFLRRGQELFGRTGGDPPAALAAAARRVEERRLSLALMETLHDWVFARSHLETVAPEEGRPQHFFEERTVAGEKRPILTVWARPAAIPAATGGIAAAGFRVSLEGLEAAAKEALLAASPGSRLSVRVFPRPDVEGFIDLAGLRGERSFVRLGLEKPVWERLVGGARKPFAFAKALIVFLMAVLALALLTLLHGVRREMALSRMKTEFVANVSHELKTPLALIRLFGETLLLGRASDESREKYYRIITRESERLTHLISSVLSFASIEAGRKTYDLKSCDIGETVRGTYESYRFHLDEKGFTHRLDCPPELPRVLADPDAVSEAVINLLENAMKYSLERKEVRVSVAAGGAEVKVSVADRGVGISPEDQKRVFEDYYRTREARALGTRGSGLGLSLVRHILKAHGGRVDLASEPGGGSVFTLVFPATEA